MKTKRGKKAPEQHTHHVVQDCVFNGVVWDPVALTTVQTVADALLNLTRLFRSADTQMGPLLQVGSPVTVTDSHFKVKP